jgi:hypothetical protein
MKEKVFQPRPPGIRPEVLERGDDAGGRKCATFWRDPRRWVEAERSVSPTERDGFDAIADRELVALVKFFDRRHEPGAKP